MKTVTLDEIGLFAYVSPLMDEAFKNFPDTIAREKWNVVENAPQSVESERRMTLATDSGEYSIEFRRDAYNGESSAVLWDVNGSTTLSQCPKTIFAMLDGRIERLRLAAQVKNAKHVKKMSMDEMNFAASVSKQMDDISKAYPETIGKAKWDMSIVRNPGMSIHMKSEIYTLDFGHKCEAVIVRGNKTGYVLWTGSLGVVSPRLNDDMMIQQQTVSSANITTVGTISSGTLPDLQEHFNKSPPTIEQMQAVEKRLEEAREVVKRSEHVLKCMMVSHLKMFSY